jgi:hypothetical protein
MNLQSYDDDVPLHPGVHAENDDVLDDMLSPVYRPCPWLQAWLVAAGPARGCRPGAVCMLIFMV